MRCRSCQLNPSISFLVVLVCAVSCHGEPGSPGQVAGGPLTGSAYEEAEQLFHAGDYQQAVEYCDRTLDDLFPTRVYNRIQALAVRSCLRLNRREDALQRVETICKRDPESPYLSLVPLVWDDRLPSDERYVASAEDLRAASVVRQLAAASSLLPDSRYTARCVEILTGIRAERRLPLSVLAETQLWRVDMPTVEKVYLPTVRRWQKRAAALPESLRAGPQFLVGRALRMRHKPDQAALELLWLPLMQTDDPCLAAAALAESIRCLEETGRSASAQRLRRELQDRFGQTSAARRLAESDSNPSATGPSE